MGFNSGLKGLIRVFNCRATYMRPQQTILLVIRKEGSQL
jgi:hypothetical protein